MAAGVSAPPRIPAYLSLGAYMGAIIGYARIPWRITYSDSRGLRGSPITVAILVIIAEISTGTKAQA